MAVYVQLSGDPTVFACRCKREKIHLLRFVDGSIRFYELVLYKMCYEKDIHSQTAKRVYDVIKTNDKWACSCPDHKFRHVCGKHIRRVEYSIQLGEEIRQEKKAVSSSVIVSDCGFCHSQNIKKHIIRNNKMGDIQRFVCADCHRTFLINLGFKKMKSSSEIIVNALQLYFSGESLRNIQKFLKIQGVTVNPSTIYRWIIKYIKIMKGHLDKIFSQIGDVWRSDEVYINIHGEFRDEEKIFRIIMKKDSAIIDGYPLYHNYIRKYLSLDDNISASKTGIIIENAKHFAQLVEWRSN